MGLLGKFRAAVGGVIGGLALREALTPPLSSTIDPDDDKFRSITESQNKLQKLRDMDAWRRERSVELAYLLYLAYPLARRATNIVRDFVVGEGISFKARNPLVQTLLKDFWYDSTNRFDLKQYLKALELGLYGEQFYQVFVNKENGFVRLGYVDPGQVKEVLLNPENAEDPQWVVTKDGKRLRIIHVEDDVNSPAYGKLVGDVFFFAINKVSNAARGNPDLLPALDWLELHERFLIGIQEAADLKTSAIWDVTVEGADKKKLDEIRKEFTNIKKGSARIHNEKVTVKTVTPDLQVGEMAAQAQLLKRHIAAGANLPEHWLSEGAEGGAAAAEAGVPTVKHLRSRQKYFVYMIEYIFDFVIDQAMLAGALSDKLSEDELQYSVIAPQIWAVDTQRITVSLQTGAQALMLAEQNGWLTKPEAAQTFRFIAGQLGVDMGASSEVQRTHTDSNAGYTDPYARKMGEWSKRMADAMKGRDVGPSVVQPAA